MVGQIYQSRKISIAALTLLAAILINCSASAQLFKKKKSANQEKERSAYAYQTYSTTKPKEKKRGLSGGKETKFHFEKPKNPMSYSTLDQQVSFLYFGHKRIPPRRPPGRMKFCKVCGIRH
jgi:uncharacterized cupredoxin-like copper-binding protein